jgi:hypothetical protein
VEFGLSDESPVLQNLMCNGTEYYLSDCRGYELGDVTGDYCLSGNYQAGVRCLEVPTPTSPCYDGQLLFENTTSSYTDDGYYVYGGRVEVCYNGTYGPVCDEGWTDNDAAVVCMNMGYNSPYYRHEATRGMVFGLSDETPVLQNLMCNGTEYYLSDCSGGYELGDVTGDYCLSGNYQAGVRVTGDYCLSGNDQAGIRCVEIPTPTTPCYDGQLTLENYTNSYTVNGSFFYGMFGSSNSNLTLLRWTASL